MEAVENKTPGKLRGANYWRLWLLDAVLVSGSLLFLLASQFGSYEFFGTAAFMAALPLIPALVLIGGGGSTAFGLTKVMIEKRAIAAGRARVLLLGPAVVVSVVFVLLAFRESPARRLAYICHGHAPVAARQVQAAGYSAFLNEEWLAVFQVGQKDFDAMVAQVGMSPADAFEFRNVLERSALKHSRVFRGLPPGGDWLCYRRVYKPDAEHERGSVYAVFDRALATAAVFREYHD